MKRYAGVEVESFNMANVLMLLSRSHDDDGRIDLNEADHHRVFECKTCNRQFPSFQALGGHRASHKKPRLADHDPNQDRTQSAVTKPKVHECSICGLEFAIGQALGGHMRRHRSSNRDHGTVNKIKSSNNNGKRVVLLDLNLPPCEDEMEMVECRKLGLGLSPMVDCFH